MLTILHTEASLGWGGQEIRIVTEALGMTARGHRVLLAASPQSALHRRAQALGLPVFPVAFSKKNPLAILALRRLIRREGVDFINTHSSTDSWTGALAALLSRRRPRLIRTRHLSTPISTSFLSRVLYDLLPDAVITTGEAVKERMVRVNGFRAEKIVSIPTGVDLERFDPRRVAPALPADGSFKIGAVGVLRRWKGHEYLVDAAPLLLAAIPEARIYIVGDGPQYANLQARIAKLHLGNHVFLLGHREDIPELLASFEVLVHPSTMYEGLPQSVLQALAMERAVVASEAGAIQEVIIPGETGFLIPPYDPGEIAAKVTEFHRDPGLRARLGNAGRKLVAEKHTTDRMLDSLEALYASLPAGKGHCAP